MRAKESMQNTPRRWLGVASSLGSTALLALAPKCPLCVAAALSSLGLGGAAASFLGPLLRPLAVLFALVAVAALVVGERRRLHARRAGHSCCVRGGESTRWGLSVPVRRH
jgi:hypothetical protein